MKWNKLKQKLNAIFTKTQKMINSLTMFFLKITIFSEVIITARKKLLHNRKV